MNRDVGIIRTGRDCERVPLVVGHKWTIDKQPLAGLVPERRLGELDLNGVMYQDHVLDPRLSPGPNFPVKSLDQVQATADQLPAPPIIPNAVSPPVGGIEGAIRVHRVADEATGSMCVHGEHKGNEEMVGVPEGFERLLSDAGVSGGVHQQHAEEHDVSSDTAGLGVVDIKCAKGADLRLFNVVKVDIMGRDVDDGPEKQLVSNLAMKPNGLVERYPFDLWADDAEQGPTHGQQDDRCVHTQDQAGTTGDPDRIFQSIERRQAGISHLFPPMPKEEREIC